MQARRNPREDSVHVRRVRGEVEGLAKIDPRRDLRICPDEATEVESFVPRPHRVPLHHPIRLVTPESRLDEREQQTLAEEETSRRLEVRAHPLGAHDQPFHQPGESIEHVVDRKERVREHDALGRRVRDVSLVPERDVLETDVCVPAHEPREAADALGDDRIALVRHRRGALLPLRERLLDLPHLGAREVPDLQGEAIERRREDRERREQLGVPVALQDLGRGRGRLQPEGFAREPLDLRRRGRVRPDRARQLADAHSRERAVEPCSIAIELEHPAEKLEPERRRLRVHAMRAPDGHGRTVLFGARENRGRRPIDAVANQRAAGLDRQRERGVEDVGRGEPEVEPAPVGPEVGGDGIDERGDIVIRRPLELRDARRARNARSLSDAARARRRNSANLGPGIESRELDSKPVLELRLLGPDRGHRRSGVASDHWGNSSRRPRRRSFHSFGTVPFTTRARAGTTLESGWRQGVAPG